MKKKRLTKILPLIAVLGLIAAVPASTTMLDGDDDDEQINLQLLLVVNRLELSTGQMEQIHGVIVGVLEQKDALEQRRAAFEEEMIGFAGTTEELDERLEVFRSETSEQTEAFREQVASAVDELKGILTLKQGEVLLQAVPGLFGQSAGGAFRFGSEQTSRLLGRLTTMAQGFGSQQQEETAQGAVRERLLSTLRERLEQRSDAAPSQRPGAERSIGGRLMGRIAQRGVQAPSRSACPQLGRGRLGSMCDSPQTRQTQRFNVLEELAELLRRKLEVLE